MKMKRTALGASLLLLGLTVSYTPQLMADVTVTEPIGGNDVSADKCLNSTNGASFTALGNIVITEGATTDFAVGNNKTLILMLPFGWQFDTSAGSISFANSRDITAASISVASDTVTV